MRIDTELIIHSIEFANIGYILQEVIKLCQPPVSGQNMQPIDREQSQEIETSCVCVHSALARPMPSLSPAIRDYNDSTTCYTFDICRAVEATAICTGVWVQVHLDNSATVSTRPVLHTQLLHTHHNPGDTAPFRTASVLFGNARVSSLRTLQTSQYTVFWRSF